MFQKKFFAVILIGIIFSSPQIFLEKVFAVPNPEISPNVQWYWLKSDDKYSKYFDPDSVKVMKKAKTDSGREVPTEIEAWTKTTYSPEGAAETIKSYGISSILPDPSILSYSLALFKINPQTRMIQYAREDFFNAKNQIIWSKTDGRVKEINSQAFDEDFYAAIVDEVFRQGEVERKNASDRWIELWNYTDKEGLTTNVSADTTTMQLKGTNLILWEWQTTKNAEGQTVEIRFMKKAVNLSQGTEKISSGEVWDSNTKRWRDLDDENDGNYKMIENSSPEYKGLIRLRAYVKGYMNWVTRYAIR